MSKYPWKEKNNKFTWLRSLYNPFKEQLFTELLWMTASGFLVIDRTDSKFEINSFQKSIKRLKKNNCWESIFRNIPSASAIPIKLSSIEIKLICRCQ